jgi:hypothetical protein
MLCVSINYSGEDCFVSLAEPVRGLIKLLYLKIDAPDGEV